MAVDLEYDAPAQEQANDHPVQGCPPLPGKLFEPVWSLAGTECRFKVLQVYAAYHQPTPVKHVASCISTDSISLSHFHCSSSQVLVAIP